MRISTLAACTLAMFAAQTCTHQAIATPQDPAISPEGEPTDALPSEETPEPTQAIATPETFVTESFTADPFTADSSSVLISEVDPPSSDSAIPLAEAIAPSENKELNAEAITPSEKRSPIAAEDSLGEIAPVESSSNADGWVAQTLTSPSRLERGIDIPVEMPPTSQVPSLTAQARPTSRSVAPTRVRIEDQELPVPGVLPLSFNFPIRTRLVSNSSITTNTPITDQDFPNPLPRANIGSLEELARYREARTLAINIWAEQVRGCMVNEYPNLVSLRDGVGPDGSKVEEEVPVLFNGSRGKIVRNASGRLVCPVA